MRLRLLRLMTGSTWVQWAGFSVGSLSPHCTSRFTSPLRHDFLLACLCGSLFSASISDYLGRKHSLKLLSMTIILLLVYFLVMNPQSVLPYVLLGACAGIYVAVAPVYAAECQLPVHRGKVTGLFIFSTYVGIFYSSLVQIYLPYPWKDAIILFPATLVMILITLSLCFAPESPHWILSHKTPYECIDSLERLRKSNDVSREFKALYLALSEDAKYEESWLELLTNGSLRYRLLLTCSVQCLLPLLGNMIFILSDMSTLSLLSSLIGFDADLYAISQLLLICSAFTILGCLIAVCLSDTWGRRSLLLYSLLATAVLWMTVMLIIAERQCSPSISVTWTRVLRVVGFLALWTTCLLLGVSNVVGWTYSYEIFPLRVRSKASSLVTCCFFLSPECGVGVINRLQSLTVLKLYSFLMFTVILFALVFLFAPETQIHRIEDMEDLFSISYESYSCCCPLLGMKSFEAKEQVEVTPLARGRGGSSNTVEIHQPPITAEVSFEPGRLHKYSSSLQALEFRYMQLPKFESRFKDRVLSNTALRPISQTT